MRTCMYSPRMFGWRPLPSCTRQLVCTSRKHNAMVYRLQHAQAIGVANKTQSLWACGLCQMIQNVIKPVFCLICLIIIMFVWQNPVVAMSLEISTFTFAATLCIPAVISNQIYSILWNSQYCTSLLFEWGSQGDITWSLPESVSSDLLDNFFSITFTGGNGYSVFAYSHPSLQCGTRSSTPFCWSLLFFSLVNYLARFQSS